MQEAKAAFTPYKTTVTRESVPTLQKINDITGVSRYADVPADQFVDRMAVKDAIAAFKHAPVKTPEIKVANIVTKQEPIEQVIERMHPYPQAGLKYAETGQRLMNETLKKRLDCYKAFTSNQPQIPRHAALLEHAQLKTLNFDAPIKLTKIKEFPKFVPIECLPKSKFYDFLASKLKVVE